MNKELEVINLTLDLMKRFIQPTIFEGLKSDLNAIDFKLNRLAKVEELLGLYRKHINTLCKKDREGVKNSMFSSEHLAYELYEKIKQLEEELNNGNN